MNETNVWNLVINGYHLLPVKDPKVLESLILSCITDLKYWSPDALFELRDGLTRDISTFVRIMASEKKGSEKGVLTRFANSLLESLNYTPSPEKILAYLYERILISDSLGTLRKFGFSNEYGDHVRGNPEKRSVI